MGFEDIDPHRFCFVAFVVKTEGYGGFWRYRLSSICFVAFVVKIEDCGGF